MVRNNWQIERDILTVAKSGAQKTKLVYGANLNFNIIKKYLQWLYIRGYLKKEETKKGIVYTTTELGLSRMNIINSL